VHGVRREAKRRTQAVGPDQPGIGDEDDPRSVHRLPFQAIAPVYLFLALTQSHFRRCPFMDNRPEIRQIGEQRRNGRPHSHGWLARAQHAANSTHGLTTLDVAAVSITRGAAAGAWLFRQPVAPTAHPPRATCAAA